MGRRPGGGREARLSEGHRPRAQLPESARCWQSPRTSFVQRKMRSGAPVSRVRWTAVASGDHLRCGSRDWRGRRPPPPLPAGLVPHRPYRPADAAPAAASSRARDLLLRAVLRLEAARHGGGRARGLLLGGNASSRWTRSAGCFVKQRDRHTAPLPQLQQARRRFRDVPQSVHIAPGFIAPLPLPLAAPPPREQGTRPLRPTARSPPPGRAAASAVDVLVRTGRSEMRSRRSASQSPVVNAGTAKRRCSNCGGTAAGAQ